jgi:DNA-binding beta-propeller fold protein YncE
VKLRAAAAALAALSLVTGCAAQRGGSSSAAVPATTVAPERDYFVFVAAEATDEVTLIRFGPDGANIERRREVGMNPADPDGPHGLAVAPGGRHYFVTTAHGVPNGYLWKFATENDAAAGRVELGMFPASMQVSPDGLYVYVVNFNLHGEMVPSSVSIVAASEMIEVARLQTCTMPHGSRFNPQGTRHYSTCMMDEMLIEIDTREFEVSRHFIVAPGAEQGMQGRPGAHDGAMHGGHDTSPATPANAKCSPTWAAPSADGGRIYIACNAASDIVEIDAGDWTLVRRIPAGPGVYNLAVTRDGRLLIATNKRGQSVSIIDTASGREVARIPTLRPVVHGVAMADDDRYAFISVEGYGAEPGTVEIIDLRSLSRVAAVDVGQMAGGIDFWKSEPVTSAVQRAR